MPWYLQDWQYLPKSSFTLSHQSWQLANSKQKCSTTLNNDWLDFDTGWFRNRKTFTFSFWSPSRGPTSTIFTLSGNEWVADTLTCQITHKKIDKHTHALKRANTNNITSTHSDLRTKHLRIWARRQQKSAERVGEPEYKRADQDQLSSQAPPSSHAPNSPDVIMCDLNLDLAIIRDQISRGLSAPEPLFYYCFLAVILLLFFSRYFIVFLLRFFCSKPIRIITS